MQIGKKLVILSLLSLSFSMLYAEDYWVFFYGENNKTLTPKEFNVKETENFAIIFWQELLKEWFIEDELVDVIEMFLWLDSVEDIEQVKWDVKDIYWKKVTLASKVILYKLPSFEHYKHEVIKYVKNSTGDEILNLVSKIEKSTEWKKNEDFVLNLRKVGKLYKEDAKLDKELAELKRKNKLLEELLGNLQKL